MTLFLRLVFIAGFSFGALSAVGAQDSSCMIAAEPLADAKLTFDPGLILSRKGLDPALVHFTFKVDLDSHRYWIDTYYAQHLALKMSFDVVKRRNGLVVYEAFTGELQSYKGDKHFFYGKGLGTVAYLVAAKLIFDQTNVAISSDRLPGKRRGSVTAEAQAVWKRFERLGLAQLTPIGARSYYVMKPEALIGPDFSLVAKFSQGRIQQKPSD